MMLCLVARDNQILQDEICGIRQASCEVDQEQGSGRHLYRIVVCLAATGARCAQVRRMRVGNLQNSARRLMVREWRCGNSGSDPVPVGDDVIGVLFPKSPGGQAMHLFSSDGSMDRSRGASRGRSLMGNARKGSSCSLDRIHSTDGADIGPLVQHPSSRAEFSGDRRECGRRAARVAIAGLATPISANDRTSRSAIDSIRPRPAAIRGSLEPATLAPQDISRSPPPSASPLSALPIDRLAFPRIAVKKKCLETAFSNSSKGLQPPFWSKLGQLFPTNIWQGADNGGNTDPFACAARHARRAVPDGLG